MQIYFIAGRKNFHYVLSNTTQVASEVLNVGWLGFFVCFCGQINGLNFGKKVFHCLLHFELHSIFSLFALEDQR